MMQKQVEIIILMKFIQLMEDVIQMEKYQENYSKNARMIARVQYYFVLFVCVFL